MKLYNQLTNRIEPFQPEGRSATMYVCGITPYDTTHLGHAFTYSSYDVLVRYLEYCGHKVAYCQNVTDVDDDILREAHKAGMDWRELGKRWTVHYIHNMQALNVLPPNFYPRSSEVIPDIITRTEYLLTAGLAYRAGGNVYYHVKEWPEFGDLSKVPPSEMLPIANKRGNKADDPNKRDPLDCVLWQASQGGEPSWESPWGLGRPGWHIECSVMATRFLGNCIDLHGGGADLVFPHHECEIAETEPATGVRPFAHFWTYTAMVGYEGEKMSKSLGNLVMVDDLLQNYSADALRVYLAEHHYREPWDYNEKELAQAADLAEKLRAAAGMHSFSGRTVYPRQAQLDFQACLDNDLDTPGALAVLNRLAQEIHTGVRGRLNVRSAQKMLREMAGVLGLRLDAPEPQERVIAGWQEHLRQITGGENDGREA